MRKLREQQALADKVRCPALALAATPLECRKARCMAWVAGTVCAGRHGLKHAPLALLPQMDAEEEARQAAMRKQRG